MVATRGAGGHLAPLHERDAQTAQREVMCERTAGATATHDENVPVVPIGLHLKSSVGPDGTVRSRPGADIRSRYSKGAGTFP